MCNQLCLAKRKYFIGKIGNIQEHLGVKDIKRFF